MREKPRTDRLGVSALDHFISEHGWLFREQTIHDFGIDAHIEIFSEERPTGKLIALQIKSGESFFSEEVCDGFVFRTDDKHVDYWIEHSMPVVLVLYNTLTKQACWQSITKETVKKTGKCWKVRVPKANLFDESERFFQEMSNLTQPDPYTRRLNRLRIDRHWLDLIAHGHQVFVRFDDWVNKSLKRYQITISINGYREIWPMVYTPEVGIEQMLNHFFPWADFSMDLDAHEEEARLNWENECPSFRDEETGEVHYSMPFFEWYKPPLEHIVPVSENGETASYSLLLTLNEFGEGFLRVDDYLADKNAPEKIGFTFD